MTPTSDQIRQMLHEVPDYAMTEPEWHRLDRVMRSQREKHGEQATAWWFADGGRTEWRRVACRNGQGGSVGR